MEDIGREYRNLRRLFNVLERLADPDVKDPMQPNKREVVLEWNPRLGIVERPDYERDSEDKP